jgi:hypothetical protein
MKKFLSNFSSTQLCIGLAIVGMIVLISWLLISDHNLRPVVSTQSSTATTNSDSVCPDTNSSQACIESADAKLVAFSSLPADLQKVAISQTEIYAPTCVKNGHLVDISGQDYDPQVIYASVGSAIITVGCDSGSSGLFVKSSKTKQWQLIEKTQYGFSCDRVFSNPIPKKLLELSGGKAECTDSKGNLLPYDQESARRFY